MPVSSDLHSVRRWKRGFVAAWVVTLLSVGAAVPVYASVLPGTSVTASSAEFILHIEVDGVPDTVTCTQLTDTFVVTSGESSKATIPPPTVDHCTDSLEPDEPDAYVNLDTNDKNGNWKLEAPAFGSGGCHKDVFLDSDPKGPRSHRRFCPVAKEFWHPLDHYS